MKRLFLLVAAFLLCSTMGFAQEWVGIKSNTPVPFETSLISSSEKEVVVDVKVKGFYSEEVETPNGKQLVITGADMASTLVKGAPNLPMFPVSIIIGDKAEMEVSVIESEYTDIEGVEIAPSKGNISRQTNPAEVQYVYGEMYQKDAFYPESQASLQDPYILRDFRGQNIMVYPYAYNPVTKTLRVYTHLVIAAKKVSEDGKNQKLNSRSGALTIDPEVRASYKRRFINYDTSSKYSFIEDEGEMLIVCVDEYMTALQDLVNWKNISGRPTSIVAYSQTGADLKRYISNYYRSHPNLTHVLLVGEYNNLPPCDIIVNISGYYYAAKSDNTYGMLDGDDFYEEVLVGRLSVASYQDAKNQVSKIIYYERDIKEDATWLKRGVGVGSTEGVGHYNESDYRHIDYIRDTLLNYTYTEVYQRYDEVDGYKVSGDDLANDFNNGLGIANYCNHGEQLKWVLGDFDIDDVNNLTNDYMLPFIWSSACYNGQFDNVECFAEAWMRSMNNVTGAPTGAVGGMFSWISQPWQPPMYGQDEMVNILTGYHEGYKHTLGGASLNGNMYILDMAPEDDGNTHNTWMLFGDPSMMLRTDAPKSMNVTCSTTTLLVGMSELTVNADTEYGIATLSRNNEVLASTHIKNGIAILSFEELESTDDLKLVVVGYNKVTEVIDIAVSTNEDAFLIYNSYELNESDGQADYGETIDMTLLVKNIGGTKAENITVQLVPRSEYVVMLQDKASVASVAVDQIVSIQNEFQFVVLNDVPDQMELFFDVKCSDGNNTWTSSFSIIANAPDFEVKEIYVNKTSLQSGDNAKLHIEVANVGHSAVPRVVTDFYSSSSDIEFSDMGVVTENVESGEIFIVEADFNILSSVVSGSIYEIDYAITSGHYIYQGVYYITVGSSFEGFETANFNNFNWQFGGDKAWTVVSGGYESSYCAKSGAISDAQTSSMYMVVNLPEEGNVSFYKKLHCDYYDKLQFVIDGKIEEEWRGNNGTVVDWSLASYVIPAGIHTLEWRYKKDKTDSFGSDCVYVDNISLPSCNVVTSLLAVKDLDADVKDDDVTLTWTAADADEYIIKRDGVEVSVQTTTTFTETLPQGIYTYSVVARKGNIYSLPVFVAVNVGIIDEVEEVVNVTVNVYPNPTTGILNVEMDSNFDAIVYNYQGQIVNKFFNSNSQIDLSDLTSGIYFVEIRTDNSAVVKKIIVK